MTKSLLWLAVYLSTMVFADDEATDAARRLELFEQTKFLWVSEFSAAIERFQGDDDPMTVQFRC